MHQHRIRSLASLLLAMAVLIVTTGTALADPGPHPEFVEQQESIAELSQLSGEDFEIGYINRIIPHHQGALAMSETMRDKAVHPELREEAIKSIEEQQMEIELLSNYLTTTYGQEVTPDPAFVMSDAMMQHLRDAAPEAAEIMFMLMMREHQQSAIEMGELVLEKTDSQVLVDQATMMIESQRMQQDLFASYLNEWYGVDAPAVTGDMQAAMDYAMSVIMMPGMPNTGAGGSAITENNARPNLVVVSAIGLAMLSGAIGYLFRRSVA